MNYEIVNLDEKHIVGLIKNTTNEEEKSIKDIGSLWSNFFNNDYYSKICGKVNKKTIGLYTDYEGDFTKPFNFLTCVEVNSESIVQYPLVYKRIPAGKYAKFIIKGDIQKSVALFWSKLWKMNLDRLYSYDFEEYQENENSDLKNQEIHVYISIR